MKDMGRATRDTVAAIVRIVQDSRLGEFDFSAVVTYNTETRQLGAVFHFAQHGDLATSADLSAFAAEILAAGSRVVTDPEFVKAMIETQPASGPVTKH